MLKPKNARPASRTARAALFGAAIAAAALATVAAQAQAPATPATPAAPAAAGAAAPAAAGPVPSFTADQAKRGADVYAQNCAMCHGDHLDDGQFGPPLKGPAHTSYWQGKTAADLYTYLSTMMPPTAPGGLTPQNYADSYAYILQTDGAAPGSTELSSDANTLKANAPTP